MRFVPLPTILVITNNTLKEIKNEKIIIVLLAIISITKSINAQLKVDSIGNVAIATTSTNMNAELRVGNSFCGSDNWTSVGIASSPKIKENAKNIGVCGQSASTYSTGSNFGVLGSTQLNAFHGRNYGVCGMISFNQSLPFYGGAGIYAIDNPFTYSMSLSNIQGLYAAYFYGSTNLNGQTMAREIYTPADSRLSEDIVPIEARNGDGMQTLDNLLRMNVLEFNIKSTHELKAPEEMEGEVTDEIREAYEYVKKKEEVMYSRRHYGLSAQELQEIYPDLVLEGQDGYLYINYTELVPLLIRSIQELKQELNEIKENGNGIKKAPQTTSVNTTDIISQSVLYQNAPNPFKEKTTIRFKLDDEAMDAAICIFDMSGKMLKKLPISNGMESVSVNGYELGEGMFLYSLLVNGQEVDTKRMILSK